MTVFSRRSFESYLEIDHRESPGFSEQQARDIGLPLSVGSKCFQYITRKCPICEAMLVMNPQRTRDRFYCQRCDDYHCDQCGAIAKTALKCVPIKQVIDKLMDAFAKGPTSPSKLVLPT